MVFAILFGEWNRIYWRPISLNRADGNLILQINN